MLFIAASSLYLGGCTREDSDDSGTNNPSIVGSWKVVDSDCHDTYSHNSSYLAEKQWSEVGKIWTFDQYRFFPNGSGKFYDYYVDEKSQKLIIEDFEPFLMTLTSDSLYLKNGYSWGQPIKGEQGDWYVRITLVRQ